MKIREKIGRAVAKWFGWGDMYGYDSPYSGGWVDRWGKQKSPDKGQLLGEYKNTAYACANLNTQGVLNSQLRLYQKAKTGQKLLYPVKGVNLAETQRLCEKHQVRLGDNERIVEITDHQITKLLSRPNPFCDYLTLLELTQLFQEICGSAYWYIPKNRWGRPSQIFLLLPQFVVPITDRATGYPLAYEYGTTGDKQTYQVDEIVPFLVPSLFRPWLDGYSPLNSVYEQVSVEDKMLATEQAILDNDARPGGVINVKDGTTEDQAERLERKFNNKLRRAGSGAWIVPPEDVTINPLSFSPKDLAVLQIHATTKVSICNAYGVPYSLLADSSGSQYQVHATLLLQHVETAISPRLKRNQSVLNQYLVSRFDDSGNLFLAYDDPSPRNRELELDEDTRLVAGNIMVPNEIRRKRGLEPEPWGEMPLCILQQQTEIESTDTSNEEIGDDDENPYKEHGPAPDEVTPFATDEPMGDIGDVLSILSHLLRNRITREQAIRLVMHTLHVEEEEAERIVGEYDPEQERELDDDQDDPEDDNGIDELEDDEKSGGDDDQAGDQAAEKKKVKGYKRDPAHGQKLPTGSELRKILKGYFARQCETVLASLQGHKGFKAHLPSEFIPLDRWTPELANKSQPVLELWAQKGYEGEADKITQRAGISDEVFNVTSPKLADAVKKAALSFAESTNRTTTLELNEALAALRQELMAGLIDGDPVDELTKRVQKVFHAANKSRAKLIAQTEASRSHHQGMRQAAIDSGVVVGWELLLSSNACPKCVAQKNEKGKIGLHENFAHDMTAPPAYRDVFVPLHVFCRCTVTEILDIQAEPQAENDTESLS